MLELLTICIFTVFLVHFYFIRYKEYQLWHKLNDKEAYISEYNHVYTPSKSLPLLGKIETAHKMEKDNIIEIVNYNENEVILDVFDERKNLVYQFFSPKYLLFSAGYSYTHSLEIDKKYSFFLTSIEEKCLATFRNVKYNKIKPQNILSPYQDLVFYQEDEEIMKKIINRYSNNRIERANIKDSWPQSGVVMEKDIYLRRGERVLLLTNNKNKILQTMEIITDNDSYFLPILGNNKLWSHWLTTENDTKITIRERLNNISKNSIFNPFLLILC